MPNTTAETTVSPLNLRRFWQPELIVLVLFALLSTVPFWLSKLDIDTARLFYHPENPTSPWFEQYQPLWRFFYHAAPYITGVLLLGSLVVLAFSQFSQALARRRVYALFVLLSVVLGPGLVINGILKEHWGRPRPHQVQALGGHMQYVPPGEIGVPGKGFSFPCGHSSSGFVWAVFWFIWRRRRPRLAALALLGAIAGGTLLGVGRMSAGAHFLSDVLWSAWLPWSISWALYYFVLRVPQRETLPPAPLPERIRLLPLLGYSALALAVLYSLAMATPQDRHLEFNPSPTQLAAAKVIELDMAQGNIELQAGPAYKGIEITTQFSGFGLPTNSVAIHQTLDNGVLHYSLTPKGVYSELSGQMSIHIGSLGNTTLRVTAANGDIRIDKPLPAGLQLELKAPKGQVIKDGQ